MMEFFQFGATAIRDIGVYDLENWSEGFNNLYTITFNNLFDKDRKHVWTFASYDSEQAVFSDRNCFPRCIIKKMERITL